MHAQGASVVPGAVVGVGMAGLIGICEDKYWVRQTKMCKLLKGGI